MISENIKTYFDRAVDIVFSIILVFIILGIAIGTVQLFASTWELLAMKGITGHYIDLIADVLTLYVLIELSRSLIEYFNTKRLRLTFIIDGAFVFILREVLIGLFKHNIAPDMLYALSFLMLVLGALRIASVVLYQREMKISQQENT